jgi:hypothetical protein
MHNIPYPKQCTKPKTLVQMMRCQADLRTCLMMICRAMPENQLEVCSHSSTVAQSRRTCCESSLRLVYFVLVLI